MHMLSNDQSGGVGARGVLSRMSHACVLCGALCYCDMEDHDQPPPADCTHECDEDWEDDIEDAVTFPVHTIS